MLQNVRQGMQGTTAKVIVWSIAITFALFGAESIVGGISGEPEVAEVNGEGIPESQFKIAVERKKRQILMQMGEAADPDLIDEGLLSSTVLDGLVQEKVLEQDASNKGLYISLPMVDEFIRNMKEFQVDGEFSNERMQAVLGSAGFTLNSFRESLAKQFLIDQGRAGLIGSAFVLESEESDLIKLDRQSRNLGFSVLNAADYTSDVQVSDAELETYFAAHEDTFIQPESVDVEYIVLRKSELEGIEVSNEEVEARYQQEIQDFVAEEERRASHILIAINDEMTEEQALAKVTELKSRIDAGEDFAEIAKLESQDEGSATQGGDLGFSGKGVYVSGFEDALYALEKGQISEPVKTEFGYHLIKLEDINVNEPPALAERAAALEEEVRADKATTLYVDVSQQLADISYSSDGLQESAEELDLELKERFAVSRESQDAIFSNIKVQRALFAPENMSGENNSELIEVEDGVSVVFNVKKHTPETTKSFEQVRDEVSELVKADKASEHAQALAKAFLDRVRAGEAASLVAKDMSFAWEEKTDVRRNDFSINSEVLFKAFAMNKPVAEEAVVEGFELANGDYAIVSLSEVNDASMEDVTLIEKQQISSSLGASYGGSDYTSYMISLEGSAEVERM